MNIFFEGQLSPRKRQLLIIQYYQLFVLLLGRPVFSKFTPQKMLPQDPTWTIQRSVRGSVEARMAGFTRSQLHKGCKDITLHFV